MKKSLIALAALSAFATAAHAQSTVTVYGNLDVAYSQADNKVTAADGSVTSDRKIKNTGNGDGALSTSVIGFRGVEDLGGGTKAHFHLEYDLVDVGVGAVGTQPTSNTAAESATNTSAAGTGFGARLSYIGIDSSMGTLRLGRQAQSVHNVIVAGLAGGGNNVAGQAYSAGMNGNLNSAGIRAQDVYVNRAITYISPTFNGVTVEVQTASHTHSGAGERTTEAKQTGGALSYKAGNLTAAYGFANTDTDAGSSAVGERKVQGFSATYDFGVVKAFAMRQEQEIRDVDAGTLTTDTVANQVGLSKAFGKTTVWASYFDGTQEAGNARTKSDVGGYQVGAVYSLSKRTSAYAIYGKQDIKATTTSAKTETTQTSVGLRHSF